MKFTLQLFPITCLIGQSYAQENGKSVFGKTDIYLESTLNSLQIIGVNDATNSSPDASKECSTALHNALQNVNLKRKR
ncbi:hypothetical protein ACOKFD_05995 [Flagellimonas sp. S174]|uniref:hypothetical protein n=1 Tax=Flagellimonas sp. S174 TaxID=3410790 RepID=UPI003BF50F38